MCQQPEGGAGYVVEIFPIYLGGEAIYWLQPASELVWQVAAPLAVHPHETALGALGRLGGGPFIVHSTSWRHEQGRLILSYLAVLPARHAPAAGFETRQVRRWKLARGDAEDPPDEVRVEQVIEHGVRHLAWLVRDDPAVVSALGPGWVRVLEGYRPEPFKALEAGAEMPR